MEQPTGTPAAETAINPWLEPTAENAERAFVALARFGAPVGDITASDLINADLSYQVGIPPARIDIIGDVSGLSFHEAWERRDSFDFETLTAPVVCYHDIVVAKQAAGRPQDRRAVRALLNVKKQPPRY